MKSITKRLDKLNQSFKNNLYTKYYIDYDSSYKNTILLAGSARSGTTWLSNLINYQNEYRYIFEPFWSEKVDVFADLEKIGNAKYLRYNAEDKKLLEAIKFVLTGSIRNRWSDKFNQKFITNKRLIKGVRINLLLGWLHYQFPKLPIILLIRHPCAVVNSRIKLNWETNIDKYLIQKQLVEDFLEPFIKKIEKIRDQGDHFEKAILAWCIENYVPLKQLGQAQIYIVFYEQLCTNPELYIKKIFSFLNKEYHENILDRVKAPSQVTLNSSAIITGEKLTDAWKKNVTEKQLDKAMEILSIFSLDRIYSHKLIPQNKKLDLLIVN